MIKTIASTIASISINIHHRRLLFICFGCVMEDFFLGNQRIVFAINTTISRPTVRLTRRLDDKMRNSFSHVAFLVAPAYLHKKRSGGGIIGLAGMVDGIGHTPIRFLIHRIWSYFYKNVERYGQDLTQERCLRRGGFSVSSFCIIALICELST